jgi:toxin ParE1/3/4
VLVKLRTEAELDLVDAAAFYNSRSDGVGDSFLDYMGEQLAGLSESAEVHLQMHGCHRKFVKRFPYTNYYLLHDGIVDIVAILHQRRGQRYVGKRLNDL